MDIIDDVTFRVGQALFLLPDPSEITDAEKDELNDKLKQFPNTHWVVKDYEITPRNNSYIRFTTARLQIANIVQWLRSNRISYTTRNVTMILESNEPTIVSLIEDTLVVTRVNNQAIPHQTFYPLIYTRLK